VVEASSVRQLAAVVRLDALGCTSLLPFTHLMPSQQAQVRHPGLGFSRHLCQDHKLTELHCMSLYRAALHVDGVLAGSSHA
jgi:hypothetical protein